VNVPDYFEGIDIQSFAETWTYTLNGTENFEPLFLDGWVEEKDVGEPEGFGGYDLNLYYRAANFSDKFIILDHYWHEWIILPFLHSLNWIDNSGIDVTEPISWDKSGIKYIIMCDHFQAKAFIGYNTTTYSTFEEAWNDAEASLMLGIGFQEVQTSLNAWGIISMLLFFQMPNVHWVINALLVIPFWICIAYLAYVLVIKVIPLIAGG